MKGYAVYPVSSYDPALLLKSVRELPNGYMNVTKTLEDVMIWVDTWYMEDCYVFEVEFDMTNAEDMHGSTQYPDGRIVDVTWWKITAYESIKLINMIAYV